MFGWFGKKSDAQEIEKHAQRIGNKRAQSPDRWDSIQALSQLIVQAKKDQAPERVSSIVSAILPRFGYYTDPTITDQDEKDLAFRVVIDAGTDGVPITLPAVRMQTPAQACRATLRCKPGQERPRARAG